MLSDMKFWTWLILIVGLIKGISSSMLFDLDPSDGDGSSDGPDVSFTETSQYFINNISSYSYDPNATWMSIHAFVFDDEEGFFTFAFTEASIEGRFPGSFQENHFVENPLLQAHRLQLQKYYNDSIGSGRSFTHTTNNVSEFVEGVFNSLKFDVQVKNFEKRLACIAAEGASNYTYTIGCMNITYVGTNANPVELQYSPSAERRVFHEGSDPIPVLNGNLTVKHDDHPMFLLQELEVQLMHANKEDESLGLLGSEVEYMYDKLGGILGITVEGDTDFYEQLMLNVTYHNSNLEPLNENRTVIFTVYDGFTEGTDIEVVITVENTNDKTLIEFSDDKLTQYNEGSGLQYVDWALTITDGDTDPHIESVTIELMEVDNDEYIYLTFNSNIIQINQTLQSTINLYGIANLTDYADVLQSLQYLHNDGNPGNPTPGERTIQYTINDGRGYTNNEFKFNVSPVNDAPILSFIDVEDTSNVSLVLNGDIEKITTFVEDSPGEGVMSDIYLRDVDSNVSSVSIIFHNFGINDVYTFNDSLLNDTNIILTYSNEGKGGVILSGVASGIHYEEVLQSFTYRNKIQDDSILEEGNKTIFISANDTSNAVSDSIEIVITLKVTDDLPELIINDVIELTEGSRSVEIATPAVISLMDEENDDIERLQILLRARNGNIDDKDTLVYLSNVNTGANITRAAITYDKPGSIENVEEFLRSIRYINQEDEPTYIDEGSNELLQRYIQIIITPVDNNKPVVYDIPINITLVNDEAPLITINLNDSACNTSHPAMESSKYSKRDAHSFKRLRSRLYNRGRSNEHGLAPTVAADPALVLFSSLGYLIWSMVGMFTIAILTVIVLLYAAERKNNPVTLPEVKTASKLNNEVGFSTERGKVQTLLPQHCSDEGVPMVKEGDVPDDVVVVIPKVSDDDPTIAKTDDDTIKEKMEGKGIGALHKQCADDSNQAVYQPQSKHPSNNSNHVNHQDSPYNSHAEVKLVRTLKQVGLDSS